MHRHVCRPSDLYWEPRMLAELRRLAAIPKEQVVEIVNTGEEQFLCCKKVDSVLWRACTSGYDYAGMAASACWIREGPKIVHISEYQYQCMARVEVRLQLKDFSMPYPTVCCSMPPGKLHRAVIVCRYASDVLVCQCISHDNLNDVCTLIREYQDRPMEDSITKYADLNEDEANITSQSLRVASNMLLALSNYGCHAQYLFPAEVARGRKFVAKGDRPGRTGQRPSERLREAPMVVSLDREVLLHRAPPKRDDESVATGREMPFHQRRGHCHTVLHGKGKAERKLVLYPPILVRADLLGVDVSETTTTYV
jgi:hypothetical protein